MLTESNTNLTDGSGYADQNRPSLVKSPGNVTPGGVEKGHEITQLSAWGEGELSTDSTGYMSLILGFFWVGVLLVGLDETMIATISVPITTSLSSFSSFAWLTTAYVLGSTISQAVSGHLSDIFGRRKGLMVCYGIFAIGTLLCGLASQLPCFLAGRVLQGIGGGAIGSIVGAVETDIIPMHRRPFIEGMGNIFYGVVLALGGVYGAGIDNSIGWKVADQKRLRSSRRHIDLIGMITLLSAVVLFEFGLNNGSTTLLWSTAFVVAPLSIAAISFCIFIFWELRMASSPVVPIKAITERSVGLIQISACLATGSFTSCLFYLSIYLETLDISSVEVGLRFIPLAIVFALSSIASGYIVQLTRVYYHLNIILQFTSVIAYGLLCTLDTKSPSWHTFLFLGILGVGAGGSYVTNLMGIMTTVPNEKQATVQSATWAIRSIGIVIGLTTSSVIFQAVSRIHLRKSLQDDGLVNQFSNTIAIDMPSFAGLSASMRQAIVDAYMSALHAVFYSLLAQSLISAIVSVFIKNNVVQNDTHAE